MYDLKTLFISATSLARLLNSASEKGTMVSFETALSPIRIEAGTESSMKASIDSYPRIESIFWASTASGPMCRSGCVSSGAKTLQGMGSGRRELGSLGGGVGRLARARERPEYERVGRHDERVTRLGRVGPREGDKGRRRRPPCGRLASSGKAERRRRRRGGGRGRAYPSGGRRRQPGGAKHRSVGRGGLVVREGNGVE